MFTKSYSGNVHYLHNLKWQSVCEVGALCVKVYKYAGNVQGINYNV